MEHDDPLSELFRRADEPFPSPDFVARTMRAVRRERLPPGRRRLRSPFTLVAGWAAVIAGVSLSAVAMVMDQPIFTSTFGALVSDGIATGVWLMQFSRTGIAVLDLFGTTGLAISRAAWTREGTVGLMLMATAGAVSLSVLHRLLATEDAERGISQWQEL